MTASRTGALRLAAAAQSRFPIDPRVRPAYSTRGTLFDAEDPLKVPADGARMDNLIWIWAGYGVAGCTVLVVAGSVFGRWRERRRGYH